MHRSERKARETFPLRLRKARRAQLLTAAELGARAGISARQIYRYEWGKRYPRPATLVKLAKSLALTPRALAGYTPVLPW